MTREWITDRLPTAADGDGDGEVLLANSDRSDCRIVAFEYVHPGAPWRHTSSWVPPVEPTPAEPDRITALEQRITELETLFWAHSHPAAVEPTTEPRQ